MAKLWWWWWLASWVVVQWLLSLPVVGALMVELPRQSVPEKIEMKRVKEDRVNMGTLHPYFRRCLEIRAGK